MRDKKQRKQSFSDKFLLVLSIKALSCQKPLLGGGFKYLLFSPLFKGRFPQYFSNGLFNHHLDNRYLKVSDFFYGELWNLHLQKCHGLSPCS